MRAPSKSEILTAMPLELLPLRSDRARILNALLLPIWLLAAGIRPATADESGKGVPSPDSAVLIFAGDIMLADLPEKSIEQGVDPFRDFARILKSADATIGNLECVVSTKGKPMEGKPWTFQPHPRVLPVLARHFDIVSLANNHTGDFGHEAFIEQLTLLDQHHIAHFGGGRNCVEARTPYLLVVKGIRIALLGYNDFHPREFEAGPSWPGVAWCADEQVLADIKAARTIHKADLVIPFMHWGEEYEPVDDRQKQLARRMIDAGADVVVGGHPHCTQDPVYYQGKLILYSLGNFVFDGFEEGSGRIGWLLRLRLNKKGLLNWDTVVGHMDKDGIPSLQEDAPSPAGDPLKGTLEPRRATTNPVSPPPAPATGSSNGLHHEAILSRKCAYCMA